MRLAAVDIGSNTIQALVADLCQGRLKVVARYVETPALGAAVDASGRIGAEKTEQALEALASVVSRARASGAQAIALGATAAVRRADDKDDFLGRAASVAQAPVRLLDERAEAGLSFLGVASRHAARGLWLMADVGGASTELVWARDKRAEALVSLDLGSGVLAARCLHDPPTGQERGRARRQAARRLQESPAPLTGGRRLVVTGGTVLYLPGLLGVSSRRRLGSVDLAEAAQRLDRGSAAQLGPVLSLPVARITALRAGVEIIGALLDQAGLEAFLLSREGLPHGILLALAERGEGWFRVP